MKLRVQLGHLANGSLLPNLIPILPRSVLPNGGLFPTGAGEGDGDYSWGAGLPRKRETEMRIYNFVRFKPLHFFVRYGMLLMKM